MLVRMKATNLLEEVTPEVADLAIRNGFGELYPPGPNGCLDQSNKGLTDFLKCVLDENESRLDQVYGVDCKAAMKEVTGVLGGYTVPTELAEELLFPDTPHPIQSRATVVRMKSGTIEVPLINATGAPATGFSARFGGVNPVWLEENQAAVEMPPAFAQLSLRAHDLVGYALLSKALHDDFASVVPALKRLLGEACSFALTHDFLLGNGVGKPLGMLNAGCAVSVTRTGAGLISLVDLAKMMSRLLPGWSAATAMWVCHPSALEKLIPLVSTSSSANGEGFTLLGLPVLIHEGMSVLGTAKDLALVDCRHYVIGDRQSFTLKASRHVAFTTHQVAWRLSVRLNAAPWLGAAVTPQVGSDSLSPFVYLA